MKRFVLALVLFLGLVCSAFAKQKVSFWKAKTEEEKEHLLSWCQIEITTLVYMGCHIDCVALTEDGYLIVYEDYQ